jgi:hypothetical protein
VSSEAQLVLLGIAAVLLITAGVRFLLPLVRKDPAKRERKRRLDVNRRGRVGDAFITEVSENTIHYTYSLRGVQYETSQDVATLRDYLPTEPEKLIGQAHVKYLVNNPANSILICEEWSGLRMPPRPPASQQGRAPATQAS